MVENEANNYRLTVGNYDKVSTAGDVLSQANGQEFTTKDEDNDNETDINCARALDGGFWYNTCDSQQVPVLGITARGDNFKWNNYRLNEARMYLMCEQ